MFNGWWPKKTVKTLVAHRGPLVAQAFFSGERAMRALSGICKLHHRWPHYEGTPRLVPYFSLARASTTKGQQEPPFFFEHFCFELSVPYDICCVT